MTRCFPMIVLLGFAMFTLSGCGNQSPPSGDGNVNTQNVAKLSNSVCPIMLRQIDVDSDETVSIDWNGNNVYFCCESCLPKWKKLSEKEKQQKLDKAKVKAAN